MPKLTPKEVPYPKIETALCVGDDAMTAEDAKKLLGWTEVTDDNYDLIDCQKKRVRLLHNSNNRPFNRDRALLIAQEILNKRWRFNGENVVIGQNGSSISFQHRGVGLVFAKQIWEGKQQHHWAEFWKTEPTLETSIIYGIDESSETIRTIDNVMERTTSDVFFTEGFFPKAQRLHREKLCSTLAHAVKFLWKRTGESKDSYTEYLTHSEAIEFVRRYPKVEEAVEFLTDSNSEGAVTRYLSVGKASGVLYLMAASKTDTETFTTSRDRREESIKVTEWKKACKFWTLLAAGAPEVKSVRDARHPVEGDEDKHLSLVFSEGPSGGSSDERLTVLSRAWFKFAEDGKVTPSFWNLEKEYTLTRADDKTVSEVTLRDPSASFGGIDIGSQETDEDESVDDEPDDSGKNGVEERVAEVKARKKAKEKADEDSPDDSGPKSLKDELMDLREKHPGKLILFVRGEKFGAWGTDAHELGKVLKLGVKIQSGLHLAEFPAGKLDSHASQLTEAGHRVAILVTDNGQTTVTDWEPTKKEGAPKPVKTSK